MYILVISNAMKVVSKAKCEAYDNLYVQFENEERELCQDQRKEN